MEDGVDLVVEQRIDPGDVAAEQALRLGLGRDLGGPGEAQPSAQGAPGRRFGEEPVERRSVALARLGGEQDLVEQPGRRLAVLGRGGRPVAVLGPRWSLLLDDGRLAPRPRDGGIPRQSTPVRRRPGPSPAAFASHSGEGRTSRGPASDQDFLGMLATIRIEAVSSSNWSQGRIQAIAL